MTNKELEAQMQKILNAVVGLETIVARESGMAYAYRCVLHSLFKLGLNRVQLLDLLQDTLSEGRAKLHALEHVNQHAAEEFDAATESILTQAMGLPGESPQPGRMH